MVDEPSQGADPTQAFQSRLTKMNGDAMAFATQLFDENFQLREAKRQLGEQIAALQVKVPVDGAIVLSGDDAKAYEAYKALGTPKELKDRIDAYPTLEDENKGLKLRDSLREVADVGFGGTKLRFSVLEDRVKASGGTLQFVVKEGRDKRKAAYVKDGDKETPLEEYAEKNWADYMPSLKAEQAKRVGSANGGEGNGQPAKFDMNTMIRQQAGYPS